MRVQRGETKAESERRSHRKQSKQQQESVFRKQRSREPRFREGINRQVASGISGSGLMVGSPTYQSPNWVIVKCLNTSSQYGSSNQRADNR